MKKIAVMFLFVLLGSLTLAMSTRNVYATTTMNYGNVTLASTYTATHWNDVWDLMSGDLTLSYTVDMTGVTGVTPYAEIGIRQIGAGDFNPGPFNTYQGGAGGWMTSLVGNLAPSPGILSLHDKNNLAASGARGEGDYDCLVPTAVVAPFGSTNNHGIWFDRDSVDPYQDDDPLTPLPGGSSVPWGSHNLQTYNTGGIYTIVIQYHAISTTLGTMFATVNGMPTGFYTPAYHAGPPDFYPAGLSFKGDMTHMQVFAGLWAGGLFGNVQINSLTVTGNLLMLPLTVTSPYDTPTPTSGSYPWGTSITASVTSPVAGPAGTQYVCTGWTGTGDVSASGTTPSTTFTITQASSITWTWKTQYYLTVKTDPSGAATIAGQGWYDAAATAILTAPAFGSGSYRFWGWDVDGTPQGTTNPITVTMNAAHTATAHYSDSAVGGEWAPISTVQLLTPYIAIALAAVAALAAGSWRLFKKRW